MAEKTGPKKLDLACGQNKTPGYTGVDIAGDADVVHDLFEVPWPFKTSSVTHAVTSHFVEHIPHALPGHDRDGWWVFFDELYRVMKKGGEVIVVHPYAMNGRAFQDPSHTRYINEATWYYLTREWREAQGLDHYPVACDFEVVNIDGVGVSSETMARSQEQQAMRRTHYWNIIADLRVVLRAKK